MNIEAFFRVTYGLYVVSTANKDKFNGFVSNTVFQVTAEPPQFAIACSKNNFTANILKQSKSFAISVLQKEAKADIIGTFGYRSGADFNKFEKYNHKIGKTGAPILLEGAVAWFECSIVQTIDVGSHLLFIGKVEDGDLIDESLEPLTYAWYREVKKGKAPKNAPTYIDPDKLKQPGKKVKADIYYCTACGHVYDPEVGDPDSGIAPGTRFEDIPDDWVCPVCGAAKADFAIKD